MRDYFITLRPHQWIKNFFVLVPAFFAGKIGVLVSGPQLALTFLAFCLMASAVYILNDIVDVEKDRLHEVKSNRPLAARRITRSSAIAVLVASFALSVALAAAAELRILFIVLGYFVLNILYSLALKDISLVDISVIAIGFILRVLAGGIAADVPVSKWLIMMTFLLACCLALGKRRDDLLLEVDKNDLRPALSGYTLPFVDACLIVLSVTTIVCYVMYTVSEDVAERLHSSQIYLTSVFVLLGILRFLQIAIVEQKSGSPTLILIKDRMIQCMIVLWLIAFAVILYAS